MCFQSVLVTQIYSDDLFAGNRILYDAQIKRGNLFPFMYETWSQRECSETLFHSYRM